MKRTILLLMLLAVLPLCACRSGKDNWQAESLSDFSGRSVGFIQGGTFDSLAVESGYFPDSEAFLYYNSELDGLAAVENGKLDCFIMGRRGAGDLLKDNSRLLVFPEPVSTIDYAFAFPKGSSLTEEFNTAFRTMKEDGSWDALYEKWYGGTPAEEVAEIIQDWPGSRGTIRYWVNVGSPPLAFSGSSGVPTGYSVDLVKAAARLLDYRVEATDSDFSGLIAALQSDRADLAGRSVVVTEERKQVVDFCDSFMSDDAILIARRENVSPSLLSRIEGSAQGGVLQEAAESFRKTFLTEARWKLFLKGIGTTLSITVFSALFGSAGGFLLHLLLWRSSPVLRKALQRCGGFLSGIPVVVVLMCFFYIFFRNSSLSGTAISIVAFSVLFAISVLEMLVLGTDSVGIGQKEAAAALGISDGDAFFSVIFPQAAAHVLPVYKKELVSLMKGTAIVGYIAVQDLTKVTDIVRNRTFDAFFPLIATALIYYLLGRLILLLLDRLGASLSPERRSAAQILKGVER